MKIQFQISVNIGRDIALLARGHPIEESELVKIML